MLDARPPRAARAQEYCPLRQQPEACNLVRAREALFAGADRDHEPILSRWDRTAPVGIVGAVGVVRVVEVHDDQLVEPRGLHFEVAPGPVRLLPARRVSEREEQFVRVRGGEQRELCRKTADREPDDARSSVGLRSTGGRLHHDHLVEIDSVLLERLVDHQSIVLRVVSEPLERRTLLTHERRLRVVAKELILLRPEVLQLAHQMRPTASGPSSIPAAA